MELAHLHELSELEQSYWWHVSKRRLISRWLKEYAPSPGFVIEGGIGSAGNLLSFQQQGYRVAGLDIMPEAVAYGKQRGIDNVQVHDLHQPWPFEEKSADAVVMLDVIEHVKYPEQVLNHAAKILKQDGILVLTVPAYQWLYGDWDRALGHHRRYTKKELLEQTKHAGFETLKITHWNSFTLPAALGIRTWQKINPQSRSAEFPQVSPWMNRLLMSCADAERCVTNYVRIPCGLSIAGLFRKSSEVPDVRS